MSPFLPPLSPPADWHDLGDGWSWQPQGALGVWLRHECDADVPPDAPPPTLPEAMSLPLHRVGCAPLRHVSCREPVHLDRPVECPCGVWGWVHAGQFIRGAPGAYPDVYPR